MDSSLNRLMLDVAAAFVLFFSTTSHVAAQIPKVDCEVGDKVIVNLAGGEYEAIVTEVMGDGALIKADVIKEDGGKENWPFSANQVRSNKSSKKRNSASEENSPDETPASENQEPEIAAAESEPNRTWKSSDGKFKVSAKLAGKSGNTVRLIRTNGKATRIELVKLCEEDRKYIEAAFRKAQAETAGDPFSDIKTEPKPVKPSAESATGVDVAQGEKSTKGAVDTERDNPVEWAATAKAPPAVTPKSDAASANAIPNPTAPPPGNGRMPFLAGLFLRFGFSGFIFAPLLLCGIALLVIGLKNAKLYY